MDSNGCGCVFDYEVVVDVDVVGRIGGERPSEEVVWRENLSEESGKGGGCCYKGTESEKNMHIRGAI